MIIFEDARKCVVFIAHLRDGMPRLAGSGFFLGDALPDGRVRDIYLVTARHVIDNIRGLGVEHVYVRANTVAGGTVLARTNISDWHVDPNDSAVDVAIYHGGILDGWDHRFITFEGCITPKTFAEYAVGLGDEVAIVGLFSHHHGTRRNIPIVRIGNFAAMAEEQVTVRGGGLIDAYLVEARSMGGLSGSPVFLNLGMTRAIGGMVKHSSTGPICYLLGLVHGHYDELTSKVDGIAEDAFDAASPQARVNTGIAIVVPMHKILEVVYAHIASKPSDDPIPKSPPKPSS